MKTCPTFRPKKKEKGFRARIACLLVNLARRTHPDSEEVKAFYLQIIHDYMIYGRAITRVNPLDTVSEEDGWEHRQSRLGYVAFKFTEGLLLKNVVLAGGERLYLCDKGAMAAGCARGMSIIMQPSHGGMAPWVHVVWCEEGCPDWYINMATLQRVEIKGVPDVS